MNCWTCHEPVNSPVCVGCGAIQPPRPDADHFASLGVGRRYHLEPGEIERAWRERSRRVHPDRFAGKSAVERRMSLQWTAAINEARRVLRDPVRRARYLATGQPEPPENGSPALDPDFLEEVFDLQMEAGQDPDGVRQRAESMREQLMVEVDRLFAGWERDGADLGPVVDRLNRVKYLDNLIV